MSGVFAPDQPWARRLRERLGHSPAASRLRQGWRRLRAPPVDGESIVADVEPASLSADQPFVFQCNLCGAPNAATLASLTRESPSCAVCDSTVRSRAMAHLLTLEICGRPTALPDAAVRKTIAGIGLSDAAAYALPLASLYSYENTWFDRRPRLDIADLPASRVGRYDFVIASDVFEHIAPPVAQAFANARRLLRSGGRLIFSVPFSLEADTREHYPELHDWSIALHEGVRTLVNRTADGRLQTFTDPRFHGGPGSTLEMRLFSRAALERECARAGFARMRVAADPYLPFGIHWPAPWSVPMVACVD